MSSAKGYTLVEFLVSLAILAVLTTGAVPALGNWIAGVRISAQVNELVHVFHLARHTANATGRSVILCPSADGSRCSSNSDWQRGWLLFVADAAATPASPGNNDSVIASGVTPADIRLQANRRQFLLHPFGRRSTNGTWTICDTAGRSTARTVVVSYTGKPRATPAVRSGDGTDCRAGV